MKQRHLPPDSIGLVCQITAPVGNTVLLWLLMNTRETGESQFSYLFRSDSAEYTLHSDSLWFNYGSLAKRYGESNENRLISELQGAIPM